MKIDFLWVFGSEESISEVILWIWPYRKNSIWSPSEMPKWDNLRSNGGRMLWKYTCCGFLTVRNTFYWYFLRFGHIGQIQDGHHQKYKFGIIWDSKVVKSYENTFCGFLRVWNPYLSLFFWFGHIRKIQDGRHP